MKDMNKNNNIDNNNNNNNSNNNDLLIKGTGRSRGYKTRLKSSIVRDSNGSSSAFRQFYQSGGRDYEQYRIWLQTMPKAEHVRTPSNLLNDIHQEPAQIEPNVAVELPHSAPSPSSHPHQPISIPRFIRTYPLVKSMRHIPLRRKPELSVPLPAFFSSLLTTTSAKSQSSIPLGCHHIAVESSSSCPSLPLINWSVADVGQFIEKHFPEKNIARKFMQQKIDGRTLPLLTEDHLIRIFKMKLGPALHLLTLISNMQPKN